MPAHSPDGVLEFWFSDAAAEELEFLTQPGSSF